MKAIIEWIKSLFKKLFKKEPIDFCGTSSKKDN